MISWNHKVIDSNLSPIVPDGCRDLIVKYSPGQPTQFFISELMTTTKWINTFRDEEFYGVRLPPGRAINLELIKLTRVETPEDLVELANEATLATDAVDEALKCLSESRSSSEAAANIGVSLRTLQRIIKKYTGETPEFWRSLARSRKAAKLILLGYPLLETAYHCYFSDQPHMSRELKRLFGVNPSYIRANSHNSSHWVHQFNEKGYDAPLTGEQISIKKPLLSVT